MDEDGIYDTNDFNDRLLLGLKGTMSEAEMHFLHARMRGGTISKAKRGELKRSLPAGYVYNGDDKIVKDADDAVQNSLDLFFKTFQRTGSACATVREFNSLGLKIPKRFKSGLKKGELAWNPLTLSRTLRLLHNPLYAGTYCYGRQQIKNTPNGKKSLNMSVESWHANMANAHPAYITRQLFEENIHRLKENSCAYGAERKRTPVREGPSLLQGIIICGKCSKRMSVRYQKNCSKLVPIYMCIKDYIEHGKKVCQTVMGEKIDEEIGGLLLDMLNPLALKTAIKIEEELKARKLQTQKFYLQKVERVKYEAELARKRYMLVDPCNRLVATELESEWNHKIRELEHVSQECEIKKKEDLKQSNKALKSDIMKISNDFPKIWNSENICFREKKRMLRLLIEDVTVKNSAKKVIVGIRFKTGTSKTLFIEKKLPICEVRKTRKHIVRLVDRLTEDHAPSEIAEMLNQKGYRTWTGNLFDLRTVTRIIRTYGIKKRYAHLREKGCLSLREKMLESGLTQAEILKMREEAKIVFYKVTDRNEFLYEPKNREESLLKV